MRESKSRSSVDKESSQRQGEKTSMIQLTKDKILGRNQTRLELWEEHFKDKIVALEKKV